MMSALSGADARLPAGGLPELRRIGHVIALVAGAARFETKPRVSAMETRDHINQLQKAGCTLWPAADVEGLSRYLGHVLLGKQECIHQIIDEENVADLH